LCPGAGQNVHHSAAPCCLQSVYKHSILDVRVSCSISLSQSCLPDHICLCISRLCFKVSIPFLTRGIYLQGSCGYGVMDKTKYPYWSVAALSPSNPSYIAGPIAGCGQCFEIQCLNSGGQFAVCCSYTCPLHQLQQSSLVFNFTHCAYVPVTWTLSIDSWHSHGYHACLCLAVEVASLRQYHAMHSCKHL